VNSTPKFQAFDPDARGSDGDGERGGGEPATVPAQQERLAVHQPSADSTFAGEPAEGEMLPDSSARDEQFQEHSAENEAGRHGGEHADGESDADDAEPADGAGGEVEQQACGEDSSTDPAPKVR